jgi:neutral ceramidase
MMRFAVALGLFCTMLCTPLPAADLRVGAAAVNLQADDSMVIAGGIGPGKASGQEGELRAVAVVLEKPATGKVAIVACDVLFVTRDFVDPALAQIEKTTGIPPAKVLVNATHTHHAPCTATVHGYVRDDVFTKRVQDAIVKAVEQANAKLAGGDAQFFFKLGEENTVGANSRVLLSDSTIWWGGSMDDSLRHTGPFDPQLPVLAFRGPDQKLRALIYNHSTHTIGTRKPGLRSPSFYGLASQELENELGCTVSFLEGASGSTHNITAVSTDEAVRRMKTAITEALSKAEPHEVTRLVSLKQPFPFKVRTFDESVEDEKVSKYTRKRMAAGADSIIEVFRNMRRQLKPEQGKTRETALQAILIGDVAIVGAPAEYFTIFGVDIKNRSPFKYTYVAELANDWIGYLPNLEAHELGGYQTWMGLHSYAEPGTGERMADALVAMLKELAQP